MPAEKVTRRRRIVFKRLSSTLLQRQWYPKPTAWTNKTVRGSVSGTQVTESEGHAFPSKRKSLVDQGGPFRTSKNKILYNGLPAVKYVELKGKYSLIEQIYTGPCFPVPTQYDPTNIYEDIYIGKFPPPLDSSDVELISLGTKAIARVKPTNSIADLSVTLAELKREGLPSLMGAQFWKSRAKSLREQSRSAGGEYLNYQFGWKPLISDISKAIKAAQNAEKVISQFKRDDGRVVRRRYEFPIERETQPETSQRITAGGYGPDGQISDIVFRNGSPQGYDLKRVRTVERKRWFSGAFTYHLPIADSTAGRIARSTAEVRKLYGLSLDPEVIWNVLPWSWAIDWAVNIGDVLSNVSDAMTDGLVMPYGYMMEHTIVTDTYTANMTDAGLGIQTMSFITETKKRVRASPYGFGLTWDGFSPYQISILAALGISRR